MSRQGSEPRAEYQGLRGSCRSLFSNRTRHRVFLAMGGRVRLSGKVKIICGIILFVIAFSVRALVAVDLAPVMQTRGQPVHTMSLVFHYEALRIVKGDGVLLRDGMDSSDTSLLIHAPGYA